MPASTRMVASNAKPIEKIMENETAFMVRFVFGHVMVSPYNSVSHETRAKSSGPNFFAPSDDDTRLELSRQSR